MEIPDVLEPDTIQLIDLRSPIILCTNQKENPCRLNDDTCKITLNFTTWKLRKFFQVYLTQMFITVVHTYK